MGVELGVVEERHAELMLKDSCLEGRRVSLLLLARPVGCFVWVGEEPSSKVGGHVERCTGYGTTEGKDTVAPWLGRGQVVFVS